MASKAQKEKLAAAVKANNRRIARDNAAFAKMTPAEKRMTIARDVIAQLASGRLLATPGVWLGSSDGCLISDSDAEKDLELQAILKDTEQCEGCAMGGLFMCAVIRANKLKVSELESSSIQDDGNCPRDVEAEDTFKYLRRFFSQEQLNMIETAFEHGDGATYAGYNVAAFAADVEDPETRMRLIMENIIVNKGKFVPSKRPVETWITPGYVG